MEKLKGFYGTYREIYSKHDTDIAYEEAVIGLMTLARWDMEMATQFLDSLWGDHLACALINVKSKDIRNAVVSFTDMQRTLDRFESERNAILQ